MSQLLEPKTLTKPGFRLHRLEVYNWGTFDSVGDGKCGEVHCLEPEGDTALLIGRNGSGKSTLVDSILTLLVRPSVRNYNVAAGAKKRERDERSYIRGAYDRRSSDQDAGTQVQYLRPGNGHYSVLLACFHNAILNRSFTIAQVLYLTSDGRAERIYCFDDSKRTIAGDCSGLNRAEMLHQLKRRGFRTTRSYTEYHEWFRKATGVQRKAMDMLNQTVAVKDIQRLNAFIRDHMLETRAWGQTVDSLLTHFAQLSEAHQSLIRVRDQFRLLEPIEKFGVQWKHDSAELLESERLLAATDAFFRQQSIDLFEPECRAWSEELECLQLRKSELAGKISDVHGIVRRIENEIDNAGGDRLKEIPRIIALERKDADAKRRCHKSFQDALRTSGIVENVGNADEFERVRRRLPELKKSLQHDLCDLSARRDDAVVDVARVQSQLRSSELELDALRNRESSLPQRSVELRQKLCDALNLNARDLPFAAELITVAPDAREWEASIEMVLRELALSLLIPNHCHRAVSRYLNENQLCDSDGCGTKIVYSRVGERQRRLDGSVLDPDSLIRKLRLREGHPLLPWVRTELEENFDYRCCDSIEEFQAFHGPAITRERHVRIRDHHVKDDRADFVDPSGFVLGWDNREKQRHLTDALADVRLKLAAKEEAVAQLQSVIEERNQQLAALTQATNTRLFSDIDFMSHDDEIMRLEEEYRQLEQSNDTVRLLKVKLNEHMVLEQSLTAERDEISVREGELRSQRREAAQLVESARRTLAGLAESGELQRHEGMFERLRELLGDERVTARSFRDREMVFRRVRERERDELRAKVQPLQERLLEKMSRFLARFPEEKTDLEPSTEYLSSFLGLLESIREDDLPRHERRFKERLNDKVSREIGLLNSELERECYAIEDKIEQLNQALMQLEYRPGTHMKLDARQVSDREIKDFRGELDACLEDSAATSFEQDEARFVRIEKLIHRLRNEERWRNKVIDVRRWFDFAAREIDDATGEERSYYEDSTGQSGGEKAKLAFTILVAAIAYQYDIEPGAENSDRFHFVVVDEMFSRIDDQYSEYALELFRRFGLQLLIVAPLDAKARVTERHVGCYLLVAKDDQSHSRIHSMTARELEEYTDDAPAPARKLTRLKPK